MAAFLVKPPEKLMGLPTPVRGLNFVLQRSFKAAEPSTAKIHLAIFRTCKAIYNGAVKVLYEESVFAVDPIIEYNSSMNCTRLSQMQFIKRIGI